MGIRLIVLAALLAAGAAFARRSSDVPRPAVRPGAPALEAPPAAPPAVPESLPLPDGASPSPAAEPTLLARLRSSTDERERVELCATLGTEPGLEPRWELLARVEAETPAVREAAARALAPAADDPNVRSALERRIRLDPEKNVRVAAARALGR
jgi:hypothetical protein